MILNLQSNKPAPAPPSNRRKWKRSTKEKRLLKTRQVDKLDRGLQCLIRNIPITQIRGVDLGNTVNSFFKSMELLKKTKRWAIKKTVLF